MAGAMVLMQRLYVNVDEGPKCRYAWFQWHKKSNIGFCALVPAIFRYLSRLGSGGSTGFSVGADRCTSRSIVQHIVQGRQISQAWDRSDC